MGLTYNGQDFFERWGITVDSSKTWNKPARDREIVHVAGRNGDLILDRGNWENVEIEYNCHIDSSFAATFEEFILWLSSNLAYAELYDSHHPDVYREAFPEFEIDPTTTFTDQTGNFTITFNAKPQQFINDGVDRIVTADFTTEDAGGHLPNPESWESSPTMTVFGATNGAKIEIESAAGTYLFEIEPFDADRIFIDFSNGDAILQDDMGENVGNGNPLVTVTPPNAYSPEFPPSVDSFYAYHGGSDVDPNAGGSSDGTEDMNDDMNDGTEETQETTEYVGTLEIDPRYWRI